VIEVVSRTLLARIQLIMGDLEQADDQIRHALRVLGIQDDPQASYYPWALHAAIQCARSNYAEAWEAVTNSLQFAQAVGAGAGLAYVAYSYMLDVFCDLARIADDRSLPINQAELLQKASDVVRILNTLTPPTGQPSALRARGDLLRLQGKPDEAHRFWRKSAESARRYQMPLDEGLALLRLQDPDARRAGCEMLERIGARYYLTRQDSPST
jgi:tetratricopeptide (TPR) repeat protein